MNFFNHKAEIEPYQINLHNMQHGNQMKNAQSIGYENLNIKNLKNSKINSFDSKDVLEWQRYTDEEGEMNNKDTFLIDIPNSVEIEKNDEQKLEEMYKYYEKKYNKEQLPKHSSSNSNDTIVENDNQNEQNTKNNSFAEEQSHSYFINMYQPKNENTQKTKENQEPFKEMSERQNRYQQNKVNYSMNHSQLTALQESQKSLQDFYGNGANTNSQQTLNYDSKINIEKIIQQQEPYPMGNNSTIVEANVNEYTTWKQKINQGYDKGIFQPNNNTQNVFYTNEVNTPNLNNYVVPSNEIFDHIVNRCVNQKNGRNIKYQEDFIENRKEINPNFVNTNIEQSKKASVVGKEEHSEPLVYTEENEQRGNSISGLITRRTLGIDSNNRGDFLETTMHKPLLKQTQDMKIPFNINNRTMDINKNQNNKVWLENMHQGNIKELYSLNHMRELEKRSQVGMRDTHTLQPISNQQPNIIKPISYINNKQFITSQINEHYNTKHIKDILPEPKLYTKQNFEVPEIVQGITTNHTNGIINDCNADAILKYKDTWRLIPSKRFSLNQQFNQEIAQNSFEEFQKHLDESNAKTKHNIMNANFNALTGELTMNPKKEDYTIDPNKVYDYKDIHTSFPSYNNSLVNEKINQINANLINNHNNNKMNNNLNSLIHFQNMQPQNDINNKINTNNVENKKDDIETGKKRMPKKQNLALCGDTILKHSIKEFVSNKMKDYFNINLFNHYI